ncbi:uncharacterized protein LOC113516134 [Galleria mellonella]|uniref:Uncharacterized protein LOC113516134 n=1 Tax=Galleria mellonella TaxID=7137 RepID=A0A6J1WMT7_GALME|nr:uncharacterized protein LOC113516134 [Galleria mellonella]
MRWSEAVTLEFVKIYLKHECLWNPMHPGYKLKYQRDKAYTDISTEFKATAGKILSIPEVKIKIKNLRTTYVQQIHKILQKSSPNSIYEPSLIWFNEMDRCLKNITTNRQSSYSNSQESAEVDSSCQIWVDQELQNGITEEVNPDPLISQTDDEYDSTKADDSSKGDDTVLKIKKERNTLASYKKNKKKKFKHRSPVQDYSTDSNSECVAREDEFDIYGKYIATQLRKMDLQKALRLQLEIQNLVSEARIADISSD